LALARSSSADSTALSSTLITSRSSDSFEKSIGSMSGRISTAMVYSRSLPSSNEVISILGCVAGRRPRSLIAWAELSLTARSSTSPMTERPKRCFRTFSGTLPGRNPGSLTCLPSS